MTPKLADLREAAKLFSDSARADFLLTLSKLFSTVLDLDILGREPLFDCARPLGASRVYDFFFKLAKDGSLLSFFDPSTDLMNTSGYFSGLA